MKSRLLGAVFVCILLLPITSTLAVSYQIIDLGTLDPGNDRSASSVEDINDNGQVVGRSFRHSGESADLYHAFLYDNGTMKDLGVLGPGTNGSIARAITNSGQIVGSSDAPAVTISSLRAFLYENGIMTNLGTLGIQGSVAFDINDSGQVVGVSAGRAFLYENGIMTDLGTLPGELNSRAEAINNSGQIVGVTAPQVGGRAILYENGVWTNLGTLGGNFSIAMDINDSGQIVGNARIQL